MYSQTLIPSVFTRFYSLAALICFCDVRPYLVGLCKLSVLGVWKGVSSVVRWGSGSCIYVHECSTVHEGLYVFTQTIMQEKHVYVPTWQCVCAVSPL